MAPKQSKTKQKKVAKSEARAIVHQVECLSCIGPTWVQSQHPISLSTEPGISTDYQWGAGGRRGEEGRGEEGNKICWSEIFR